MELDRTNDQHVELAGGGMMVKNSQELAHDFRQLSDIDIVWGVAYSVWQKLSMEDRYFGGYISALDNKVKGHPADAPAAETIDLIYSYDGSNRDIYRTLTISPERAESWKWEGVWWRTDESEIMVHPGDDPLTIEELHRKAEQLRKDRTNQAIFDPAVRAIHATQQEDSKITRAQTELWNIFEGLAGITPLEAERLQSLSTDALVDKADKHESLSPLDFKLKIYKSMLAELHPDTEGGDEALYKRISELYNRLKLEKLAEN